MQKIFDKNIAFDIFYNDFVSKGFVSWVQLYERLTLADNPDMTIVNINDVEALKNKVSKYSDFFTSNGLPSITPDGKWYYGRRYDANNIGLKHRIYINFQRQDVVKIANLFIGKCIKYDVKFVFKYNKLSINSDKFLIYATDEQLPIYKTIIEELKNENSEIFDRIGEPPIASYVFEDKFGYGPEIENSGTSFNKRCALALLEAFRTSTLDLTKNLKLDDFDVKRFLDIFLNNNLSSLSQEYGEDKDVFRIKFPENEFLSYFENVKSKFINFINNTDISNEMLNNNDAIATFSLNGRRYTIYANDIIDLKKTLIDKCNKDYVCEYISSKVKESFSRDDLVLDLPKELNNERS